MVNKMIHLVVKEVISNIIETFDSHSPDKDIIGKFLTVDENSFVAVDNSTGDAWTEEFDNMQDALDWLNGKFEMSEYQERKNKHA